MQKTFFSYGYNQEIFKNLRELTIAEQIDLRDNELQTLELKNLQIKRSGDSWSVKASYPQTYAPQTTSPTP